MVTVENKFCKYCQKCVEFEPQMDTLEISTLEEKDYICTLTCVNESLCSNIRKLSESHDQGRN